MRDAFASWLVGLPITWWLAERGFKAAHLIPLCIARQVAGVSIKWCHLTGRVGIMDVYTVETERSGDRRHA